MTDISRRAFVQTSAAAAAAFAFPSGVFAFGADTIRVGLIGCGGRGTGAARDCLGGSEGVELVAMGDLVPDRLEQSRAELAKAAAADSALAAKLKVTAERCFTGFDAYQKVLAAGIDLVILATPPGFRPAASRSGGRGGQAHLRREAGRGRCGRRPVGARDVRAGAGRRGSASASARSGGTRPEYLEAIKRIHDGAIGDILSGQVYWNQGGLWSREKQADWTDARVADPQLALLHLAVRRSHRRAARAQHRRRQLGAAARIRSRAVGVGGRQFRTEARYGHIYDHFAIDFEYPNGVRVLSMCRQIPGTRSRDRRAVHRRRAARRTRPASISGREGVEVRAPPRSPSAPIRAGAHRPGRQHPGGQAASMS